MSLGVLSLVPVSAPGTTVSTFFSRSPRKPCPTRSNCAAASLTTKRTSAFGPAVPRSRTPPARGPRRGRLLRAVDQRDPWPHHPGEEAA